MKYEITPISKRILGHTVYRVRLLRDLLDLHEGSLGGWIESESNLSQEGDCWVGNEAVLNNAVIKDNAHVCGNSRVFGNVVGGKKLILTGEYGENEYFIDFMTKGPAA